MSPTLHAVVPQSLAGYFKEATQGRREQVVPPARRVKAGQFDAVETFWVNRQNAARHTWAGANMLIETPHGFFTCLLTSDPETIGGQLESWRRFCASLDFVDNPADPHHG